MSALFSLKALRLIKGGLQYCNFYFTHYLGSHTNNTQKLILKQRVTYNRSILFYQSNSCQRKALSISHKNLYFSKKSTVNWHRNLQAAHLTIKKKKFPGIAVRWPCFTENSSSRGKENIALSGIPWAKQKKKLFHRFRVKTALANSRRLTIYFKQIFDNTRKSKSKAGVINRWTRWSGKIK